MNQEQQSKETSAVQLPPATPEHYPPILIFLEMVGMKEGAGEQLILIVTLMVLVINLLIILRLMKLYKKENQQESSLGHLQQILV